MIIHTYFHCPTFIFKTTNPNNIFLFHNPLFGNSKQLTAITTKINLLHCPSSFLIHSHTYYSLSIFFGLTIFLPIFLILTLFPNPKQLSLSTHSHIYIFILPSHFKISGIAFSTTTDFTCNSSLSQFQFLSEFYFPPYLLLEHNIYQEKTMFTHYLFSGDYIHILDTTSILVTHKNVTKYCFSFTRSKCYKSPFPFLETSTHQAQPFTNCPVQQSDPSIIYLLNPKTPHETLQNHPYHHQHGH